MGPCKGAKELFYRIGNFVSSISYDLAGEFALMSRCVCVLGFDFSALLSFIKYILFWR